MAEGFPNNTDRGWLAPQLKIRPNIVQQSSTVFTDPRPSKSYQLVFDDWTIDGVAAKQIGATFPTRAMAEQYVRSKQYQKAKNLSIQEKDVEDEKFWIQITQKPKKRGKKKEYFVKVHETPDEFQNSLPEDLSRYLDLIPYGNPDHKWKNGELTSKSGRPQVIGMDPIYRAGQYFAYPKYLKPKGNKTGANFNQIADNIAPTILQYRNINGNNDRWFWGTSGNKADFDQLVESLAEEEIDLESLFDNGVAQIKGEDGKLSNKIINFAMAHGVSRASGVPIAIGGPGRGSFPIADDDRTDWGLAELQPIQLINSNLKNLGFKLGDLGTNGANLSKLEKNLLSLSQSPSYVDAWDQVTIESQKQESIQLPVLDESRKLNVGDLNDWLNENLVTSFEVIPKHATAGVKGYDGFDGLDDFIDEMSAYFDDENMKRVELKPLTDINWNDVRWEDKQGFRMRTIGDRGSGKTFKPLTQSKPSRISGVQRNRWKTLAEDGTFKKNSNWSYRRKFPSGVYENYSPIVFPNRETARVIAAFQRSNGIPTRTVQIQQKAGEEKWINLMKKGISPKLYLRRFSNVK